VTDQTVTVEGDETFRRTLAAAADDLASLDQSESARLVQQRAQAAAPKATGRLAASITAKDIGEGHSVVGSTLVYAPVIHYGWPAHSISPHPFLTDALEASGPLVEAASLREATRILSHVRGA
jgi:phage gpG-like protein